MYILFNLIPRLAKAFSGGSDTRKLTLILQLWYFALSRKTLLRGKEMRFTFNYFKKDFVVHIESIVDLAALSEVFLLGEYEWNPINDPKVIIDLGAHFGDTTLFYHLKYPSAQIYAVEPAPATFKRLLKNVSGITNIVPIQAGVAEKDGFADLNIVPSSLGNSFKVRANVQEKVTVPIYTLSTLLQMYKVSKADIIKFDIEGAEENLFISGSPDGFAEAYIGEVHTDLISMSEDNFLSQFTNFDIEKNGLSNSKRFIIKAKSKNV